MLRKARDRGDRRDKMHMLAKVLPPKQKTVTFGGPNKTKAISGQQKSDLMEYNVLKRNKKFWWFEGEDARQSEDLS